MKTIRQRIGGLIDAVRHRPIRRRDIARLTKAITMLMEAGCAPNDPPQAKALLKAATRLENIRRHAMKGDLEAVGLRIVILPPNLCKAVPPRIRSAGLHAYATACTRDGKLTYGQ